MRDISHPSRQVCSTASSLSLRPISVSVQVLEDCQVRVSELTRRVEKLSKTCRESSANKVREEFLSLPGVLRSKSLSQLVNLHVDPVIDMVVEKMDDVDTSKPKGKKLRRCHQCHTPLDEQVHVGIKTGVGVCTLPHWSGCEGDIPEGEEAKGKLWAACPDKEVSGSDADKSGSESDTDPEVVLDLHKDRKKVLTVQDAAKVMLDAANNPQGILGLGGDGLGDVTGSNLLQHRGAGQDNPSKSILTENSSSSSDEDLKLKREQVLQLQLETKERETALLKVK